MNIKERGWGSIDLVPVSQDKEKWRGGGPLMNTATKIRLS